MTLDEFSTIIKDIEQHMEGEGYFCHFHMRNGTTIEGGWRYLTDQFRGIIVISDNNGPPFYVPIFDIEFIQLSAR